MRAEIIATGTELLSGNTQDTNSLFISEELLLAGIETAFKTVVGDNSSDMEDALGHALGRADLIIVTGGLGPTVDDITREAVSNITGKCLVLNSDALIAIRERFSSRGRVYIPDNDRQAFIPEGALIMHNSEGIAPGFIVEHNGRFIAVMPGVPGEMKAMFNYELRPWLKTRHEAKQSIRRKMLRTCGMPESYVNDAIKDLLERSHPVIGLSAKKAGVDIRILVKASDPLSADNLLKDTEAEIRARLGSAVYGSDAEDLESVVATLLKQSGLKLSIAESCTGGLISKRLTEIPGSSAYFDRAAVTYSNSSKHEMLGIAKELIERCGAVSEDVAAAMASGIKDAASTDLGLSVTGIAGPDGATETKPVGLVYVALADSNGVKTEQHRILGNREFVRLRASQSALDLLRRHLLTI